MQTVHFSSRSRAEATPLTPPPKQAEATPPTQHMDPPPKQAKATPPTQHMDPPPTQAKAPPRTQHMDPPPTQGLTPPPAPPRICTHSPLSLQLCRDRCSRASSPRTSRCRCIPFSSRL